MTFKGIDNQTVEVKMLPESPQSTVVDFRPTKNPLSVHSDAPVS